MTTPTVYQRIGEFIVSFQNIESEIYGILRLIAYTDDENIRTEASKLQNSKHLNYSKLLTIADAMFARFVDLQLEPDLSIKLEFKKLMRNELKNLGFRRNTLVHSKYTPWVNVEGNEGLIRENLKRHSNSSRDEENLLPEAFKTDLEHLSDVLKRLEKFRQMVINMLYPNMQV